MNSHKNARLTLKGRERLMRRIDEMGLQVACSEVGLSPRSGAKWRARWRREGVRGLADRSSAPQRPPTVLTPGLVQQMAWLRRQRRTQRAIAAEVGVSLATVSRALAQAGLSSLTALEPADPVVRYEKDTAGELLHLDIKKLGRIVKPGYRMTGDPRDSTDGAGYECIHIAIDDHSRVSFAQHYPDEQKQSAVAFLQAAVAYYARLGIVIQRLLTDNGSAYRSTLFKKTCEGLGITHRFTRPYRPQTNGKAERFIQTSLREWAYAKTYHSSQERQDALAPWLHHYNSQRPHSALNHQPPFSRLPMNNVLKNDS